MGLTVTEIPAPAETPTVAIIVPTYNYGHFIARTLESVQAQTLADWECLIVDGGSTDDTGEVVARYRKSDPRIRITGQDGRGLSNARNVGIRRTSGRYLQLLDADDLIQPHKLETQADYLERHPDVDIVYGDTRYFLTEAPEEHLYAMVGENHPWMQHPSGQGEAVLMSLVRNNIMACNAPLLRRDVITTAGEFDEGLNSVEDWDFWLRCALAGQRFRYRSEVDTLALVRGHAGSMSRDRRRLYQAALQVRRKVAGQLPSAALQRINREAECAERAALGIEEGRQGNILLGMRHLGSAVRASERLYFKGKYLFMAAALPAALNPRWSSLAARVNRLLLRGEGRRGGAV